MDSQDIFGLYEAYLGVYEEQKDLAEKQEYDFFGRKKHGGVPAPGSYYDRYIKANQAALDKLDKEKKAKKNKQSNEELDLYDVVLDHLLDEGYCDDVESAEVIMANMSEEWLDDILEAIVDVNLLPAAKRERRNQYFLFSKKGSDAHGKYLEHPERTRGRFTAEVRRKEHEQNRGIKTKGR